MSQPQVTVIGGGMITHDQVLPSLYHLQRQNVIGEITVCALQARPLKELADSEVFQKAFPGQSFRASPDLTGDLDAAHPDLFREVIGQMPERNIAVVAVPDQLHHDVIMTALRHNQHVLTVKPLVLSIHDAIEIEREAQARDLLVGIEYHKRFDDRALLARRRYRQGCRGDQQAYRLYGLPESRIQLQGLCRLASHGNHGEL